MVNPAPFLECLPWAGLPGAYVTQNWGEMFRPYPHRGMDASGFAFRSPLVPGAPGVTVAHSNFGSFGKSVCVDYGNGLFGLLAHNDELLVPVGARVTARQPIALSGYTGDVEPAGPAGHHCHFQLQVDTRFSIDISDSRDPRAFVITEGSPMTPTETAAFNALKGRVDTLEAIVIENGFDAVCRPGTEDLFPKGTPVVPEGMDGPRIRLTGDAASEYAKRRGFSLGLAIEAVQAK